MSKGMIGRVETKMIRASEPFANPLPTVKEKKVDHKTEGFTDAANMPENEEINLPDVDEGFVDTANLPENEEINLPDSDEGFVNEESSKFTEPVIPVRSVREPSKKLQEIAESTEKNIIPPALNGLGGAPLEVAFSQIH
jgi:hypothetical protein